MLIVLKRRESFFTPTVWHLLKIKKFCNSIRKTDAQEEPLVQVQQVLRLATPQAARKSESKSAQQRQLLFLVQVMWEDRRYNLKEARPGDR
jgi:hypothetical protein